MKIATFLITAVCLTIGLYSCGETPSSPPPGVTTTQSMPLKVGNWWKYASPECADTSAYILQEIVGYRFIGSHYYYVMRTSIHNDTVFFQDVYRTDTTYWRYDGSRLMMGGKYGTDTIYEFEEFNETYSIVPIDSAFKDIGYSVLSNSDSVHVPAGTFTDCIRVISNSKGYDDQVTYYIAPGIGFVWKGWFKTSIGLKEYYIVP